MTAQSTGRSVRVALTALVSFCIACGLTGCLVSTYVLTDADAGTIQVIDVADHIVIHLSGNASTGFQWERVAPPALDDSPLEAVEEGSYESLGSAPGSPGVFTFGYEAVNEGTLSMTFAYRRPWEDEPPLATFTVVIWVR
jgi:predicted secreted protein